MFNKISCFFLLLIFLTACTVHTGKEKPDGQVDILTSAKNFLDELKIKPSEEKSDKANDETSDKIKEKNGHASAPALSHQEKIALIKKMADEKDLAILSADKIISEFGPPHYRRQDGHAQIWGYLSTYCKLDFFLYMVEDNLKNQYAEIGFYGKSLDDKGGEFTEKKYHAALCIQDLKDNHGGNPNT